VSKSRVVFVVGHEGYGKSFTLKSLTHGKTHQRRVHIKGVEFYIRRTSNDDWVEIKSYKKFIDNSVHPDRMPDLIAALCPNFDEADRYTHWILQNLKSKGYRLFFWVIMNSYKGKGSVSSKEISTLKKYGLVKTHTGKTAAGVRAKLFLKFISDEVL
jgi:ABC-type dipeptide/oligopeptide/nickel transport system ATPase component